MPKEHWGKRIVYVATGLWAYRPMDDGIVDALRQLGCEVIIAAPQDPVCELAGSHTADLLLSLNSVELLPVAKVNEVKALGIPTAVWFTDDPYYTDVTVDVARYYNYVFTLESSCVPLYQEAGCDRVHHLPFGVNTALFHPKPVDAAWRTEICFIGSAFGNRIAFFDEVADYLAGRKACIAGYWWEKLQSYPKLQHQIKPGYWIAPEDSCSYYNGARIVINMHRAIDDASNRNSRLLPAHSINPRSFEISACGTLQLTDIRSELGSYYKPGVEVETYSSPGELIEKLDYYLRHEERRNELALRGLDRTMREHTYPHRVNQLLKLIFGG
jgi:spore maturation protein CgeB